MSILLKKTNSTLSRFSKKLHSIRVREELLG